VGGVLVAGGYTTRGAAVTRQSIVATVVGCSYGGEEEEEELAFLCKMINDQLY